MKIDKKIVKYRVRKPEEKAAEPKVDAKATVTKISNVVRMHEEACRKLGLDLPDAEGH